MCTYSDCFWYFFTMRKKCEIWSICEYLQSAKIRIICNEYAETVSAKLVAAICTD